MEMGEYIDVHQGTNREMERGMNRERLKKGEKYYLLYAVVLILVLFLVLRYWAICSVR